MANRKVRLILGDQLNIAHSWFSQTDDNTLYVIAELRQESDYVTHHIQKICAFFSAMEQFAKQLESAGHQVIHLTLDDSKRYHSLSHLIEQMCQQHQANLFEFQRPDEYRLLNQLIALKLDGVVTHCVDSEHFLLPFDEIDQHFEPNKHVMMEHFYRRMRKRYNLLMQDGKPVGGKWNYDANNRNKLKQSDLPRIPQPKYFANDVCDIVERLERHQVKTIGNLEQPLLWPTNREQAQQLLEHFCEHCLYQFGRFQDAMTADHPAKWSLYHSRLSFCLNVKLLHPMEVIDAAITAFERDSVIDLSQIEGFVRQILGWREYIRGVYWANMPQYAKTNALDAKRDLPEFFWSGETKMNCIKQAVQQSLDYAYAHHIQRLMVTGNFSLIAELDPDQVDEWYLGIYIDAIEWVEMPNTRGMALFADGGIVGTKPYAASGAYINRMSDYCKGCSYDQKKRVGEGACPLNSLYWRFMHKHRARLTKNPRIGMIYRSWDQLDEEQQQEVVDTAEQYLTNLDQL